MNRTLIVTLLLTTLALTGCGRGHEDCCPAPEQPDWTVTVATTGGLCAGSCDTKLYVSSFGSVTRTRGTSDSVHRELPKAGLERLDRLVRAAQRDDLTTGPFTGTCPIAFDGQQQAITINRQSDDVTIKLDSCEDALVSDAPLLEELADIGARS
ncbi:MAG: hypothetical protein JWN72_382 [Thermoleophilia bacterium]|nr:hypothetical protein [Thermoleophilia bacterium]